MEPTLMTLEVLLPFDVFVIEERVSRIVVETRAGAFGLLPRRLDCVAAIAPGILTYQCAGTSEAYLAVDEGVLTKTGARVSVSVRRALGGTDLARLREAVEHQFLALDAQERSLRLLLAKLESGFLRRFSMLRHG